MNRVIDGIDLDGLEYVTRRYSVHETAAGITTEHIGDIVWYQMSNKELIHKGGTPNNNFLSAGFGPEGKGVKHEYYYPDGTVQTRWDLPQQDLFGRIGSHGLYSGSGCITFCDRTNYDWSWTPIDRPDAIAKEHDFNYSLAAPDNYKGYVEDTRTLGADHIMINQVNEFLSEENIGDINTLLSPTADYHGLKESHITALGQLKFIGILADYKEWKVGYMQSAGLNPDEPNDIDKVKLTDDGIQKSYINSGKGLLGKLKNYINTQALLQAYPDTK